MENRERENPEATPTRHRQPDSLNPVVAGGGWLPWRWPLYLRVLAGVILGVAFGMLFGTDPIFLGLKNKHLGELGLLVIRVLTALATPLILTAVLDAFVRTQIAGRQGAKMLMICAINVTIAFIIGLAIMNALKPGLSWRGKLDEMAGQLKGAKEVAKPEISLAPLEVLKSHTPDSIVRPFAQNDILAVVFFGVLGGAAVRTVRRRQDLAGETSIRVVEDFITAMYQVMLTILSWIVEVIPFAVFGAIAAVVGDSRETMHELLYLLWVFLRSMLLGLAIHSLIYYPLTAWLIGRKNPLVYLRGGIDAILTGMSMNSSLATVPITLHCLTKNMGVSEESARLSACVGTNFNNDGITLYEAMAVLFVAQAAGYDLTLTQQITVVLTALMASIGVAGIPASGMIVLPLVMAAAGLPDTIIAVAFPLMQAVDWIVARVRSAVNVMGDMQVAILLD